MKVAAALFLVSHLTMVASCGDDPCPGQMKGQCGLAGQCVECLTTQDCTSGVLVQALSTRESLCHSDKDCPYPAACFDNNCHHPTACNLDGECALVWPCHGEPGDPCGDGGVCSEGWCQEPCATGQDCQGGLGTCLPNGVCVYQRCSAQGECPQGTEPVDGSLACTPTG